MLVTERIKAIREAKNLSQGDIQERTGLLRCYVSRVENGHTVPSVETLQKFAKALGVETYQLFRDTDRLPGADVLPKRNGKRVSLRDQRQINEAAKLFAAIKSPRHRNIARVFLRQLGKVAVAVAILTGVSTFRTNAQEVVCKPMERGVNNWLEKGEFVRDNQICHEVRAVAKSGDVAPAVKAATKDSRARLFVEGGKDSDRQMIYKVCTNIVLSDRHDDADYILRIDRVEHVLPKPGEHDSLWLFDGRGDLRYTHKGVGRSEFKNVCSRM